MAQHQIMTGARAILRINNQPVGLFLRCSYTVSYDAAPAYVLGRYTAAEITYTGAEVVSIDAVMFRLVDHGAYTRAALPKIQELLNHDSITVSIVDRKSGKEILKVFDVRPISYSSDISARGQVEVAVRMIGIKSEDESGVQNEGGGAVGIPSFP